MIPAATALGQTARGRAHATRCDLLSARRDHAEVDAGQEGAGYELTEILQPIKPFNEQVNVISDLRTRARIRQRRHSEPQSSGRGVPERRVRRRPAPRPSLGITVDQIAAQKIGQDTPLPSLELTIEEPSLNCGDGLSCAYRDTIAWQGPTRRCRCRTTRRSCSSDCSATATPRHSARPAASSR